MSLSASDLVFYKSILVTNGSGNGGRKGQSVVATGVRHNLFPRVTAAERTAGVTRYRKQFLCNRNADDEVAFDALLFLEHPSNAGDRFYLGGGSHIDLQGDLGTYDPVWMGAGSLQLALTGGETSVKLTMENNDFQFPNGGQLHISNKFVTGATMAADVEVGDSVQLTTGTWYVIAPTTDITYPNGIYLGGNVVMSLQPASNEEWLTIADNLYTAENKGSGDGITLTPTLTSLTHGTNGICRQPDKTPVVNAMCGGVARTVTIDSTGLCSGYCSAGQLNMATGAWTTQITWTTAPDNGVAITVTYRENCWSWSGNIATISLSEAVAGAYLTTNTFGGPCVEAGDLEPLSSGWTETTVAGTYNEATYPPVLFNDGTEYDEWTLTFSSATNFTCAGVYAGSVGTGNVGVDFSPVNPDTGQPFFTIRAAGWGGTWAAGQTVRFTTTPAGAPIWLKQVVPALCAAEPSNLVTLGWYCE